MSGGNPNHDAKGKFSSGSGGGSAAHQKMAANFLRSLATKDIQRLKDRPNSSDALRIESRIKKNFAKAQRLETISAGSSPSHKVASAAKHEQLKPKSPSHR